MMYIVVHLFMMLPPKSKLPGTLFLSVSPGLRSRIRTTYAVLKKLWMKEQEARLWRSYYLPT